MRDIKVLCCTPTMVERLQEPEDLLALPLLHPVLSDRLWADVLRHFGLTLPPSCGDLRFHDAATLRRAMNAVYDAWVDKHNQPARACGESRLARQELRVEILVIAARN